jgi:hypothetical protein
MNFRKTAIVLTLESKVFFIGGGGLSIGGGMAEAFARRNVRGSANG